MPYKICGSQNNTLCKFCIVDKEINFNNVGSNDCIFLIIKNIIS